MAKKGLQVLIAALFVLAGLPMEPAEGAEEHHDHAGLGGLHAAAPGHSHGDSDDHHESPDDDCHHHAVHCCCGHAQPGSTVSAAAFDAFWRSSRLLLPTLRIARTPSVAELLHVPIA